MVSKDEGYVMMMSGFQSHEFGFVLKVSVPELERINSWRRMHRPCYNEIDSCKKVGTSETKKDFSDSPFVK
jgi:hypothetical protein